MVESKEESLQIVNLTNQDHHHNHQKDHHLRDLRDLHQKVLMQAQREEVHQRDQKDQPPHNLTDLDLLQVLMEDQHQLAQVEEAHHQKDDLSHQKEDHHLHNNINNHYQLVSHSNNQNPKNKLLNNKDRVVDCQQEDQLIW